MFKLVVLLCIGLLVATQALVCIPELCKGATFDATQCKGGIIKNGGFCQCTDACAKVEGEDCQAGRGFFGSPPIGTCDDKLHCVAVKDNPFGRGVCQKKL